MTDFSFILASCVKCDGPVTGNGNSGNRRQHIYQGLQCRTVLEESDDDQEDGDTVDEVNFSLFF